MLALEVVERQSGRILKGGFAEATLMAHVARFEIDRIHYSTLEVERSMLDVRQFLFRSARTLAAGGHAYKHCRIA